MIKYFCSLTAFVSFSSQDQLCSRNEWMKQLSVGPLPHLLQTIEGVWWMSQRNSGRQKNDLVIKAFKWHPGEWDSLTLSACVMLGKSHKPNFTDGYSVFHFRGWVHKFTSDGLFSPPHYRIIWGDSPDNSSLWRPLPLPPNFLCLQRRSKLRVRSSIDSPQSNYFFLFFLGLLFFSSPLFSAGCFL